MARGFRPDSRRAGIVAFPILLVIVLAALAGCGGGDSGSGPDESDGILQISAADLDQSPGTQGFAVDDVTEYRVRILAASRVVVDSTFAKLGPIQHDFRLRANSYIVEVEGFQDDDVLVLKGAGEATVAAGDTIPLTVDLDPALGPVEVTIAGASTATISTNGSAPIHVVIRNQDGRPVEGAEVDMTTDPVTAATITFGGTSTTGPDGSVDGTLTPKGGEATGVLRLAVDGFPVDLEPARSFSIVSPVDVNRSTLTLTNTFRVPADGESHADIRVQVVDAAGNPQANVPVGIGSTRNLGPEQLDFVQSAQTRTDAAGVFTATLTSFSSTNLAGDATIVAVADGKNLSQTGTVSFLSIVSALGTTIHVAPQEVRADGVSAADLTVEVLGVTGKRLPNVLVQLRTKDDSLFRLEPASGRTDAGGVFRSKIRSVNRTGTIIDVFADGLKTSAVGFVLFL